MFLPSHPSASSVHHAMRLVQCMKQDRLGRAAVSIIEYVGLACSAPSLLKFEYRNDFKPILDGIGKFFWSTCDTLESENCILDVHDAAESFQDEVADELRVIDITSDVMSMTSFGLKLNSCYVLKCFGFAVCIIGSECSYPCREAAKELANDLVSTTKCVSVTVLHGSHSIRHPLVTAFLPSQRLLLPTDVALLKNLRIKVTCRITKVSSSKTLSARAEHAESSPSSATVDEMIRSLSSPVIQLSPVVFEMSPISSISLYHKPVAAKIACIWVFDGHSNRTLSTTDYGVFEVHHMYIVQVIRSSAAQGGVHLHRLYFWIGPRLQRRVSAFAKIISVSNSVSNHIRKGGNNCSEVEIVVFENFVLNSNMCFSPLCLGSSLSRQVTGNNANHEFQRQKFANYDALAEFSAFFKKGIFVMDKVSYPAYGLSLPSVALGHISGRSVGSAMCTLMKREVNSLHSIGNFCIIAPTCVLLWYGRWSDSFSRKVALEFVNTHFKNRLLRKFDEGSEPQEFFSYLEHHQVGGALSENTQPRARAPEYITTAPWWVPRLFACEMETGAFAVKQCPALEQRFFKTTFCMIVDAWTSVFVWMAACASVTLLHQSTLLAERFVACCTDRSTCRVVIEHEHSESRGFRDLFVVWHDWPKVLILLHRRIDPKLHFHIFAG
jgi:hypothetical protein